jgi:hypothetical protein
MAYTAQEVAAYIAANPQLSEDELISLARENGVGADVFFDAVNNDGGRLQGQSYNDIASAYRASPTAYNAPAYSQGSTTAAAPSGGQQSGGQQSGGQQTGPYMSGNGIMATPVRDNTGNQYTPGKVTAGELRGWLDANPNVDDRQIATLMEQYQVSPQLMAEATGMNYGAVADRFQTAQSQNIPTGQLGFEQSLGQGLGDATGTLRGAESGARNDINDALGRINQLYGVNIDELRQAGTAAQDQISQGFGRAEDYYKPFQEGGTQAFNQQMALSGAMGKDAFDTANNESPYTAFLREQGMRANLAGASATGGLGGGNVQKELQRFGQGLASQGLQQQFNNLGTLSGMGLNGAQGAAGAATGGAAAQAEIGMNTANNITGQRGAQAGYEGQAGAGLANIGMQTGNNIAQMQYGTGQDIAGQRARTGELLANQYQNAANSQANLLSSQGNFLSGLTGNTYGNMINMNNSAANNAAQNQINLAGTVGDYQTQFATNAGRMINGQQLEQANLPNYQNQLGGVLNAGGAGFKLGEMGQPASQKPYVGPMSNTNPTWGSYTPPAPSPTGNVNGIPGVMQPFNVFTGNNVSNRVM